MQDNPIHQPTLYDTALLSKRCTGCKTVKNIDQFSFIASRVKAKRRHTQCRVCVAVACSRRHRKNIVHRSRQVYVNKLNRIYGLTASQHERMIREQGNLCAICHQAESIVDARSMGSGKTFSLAIDHDHVTGAIRGLLCRRCNQMIGRVHDDAGILRSAADYLDFHARKGD